MPAAVLSVYNDLPGELGQRWPGWAGSAARREAAARKLRIYNEDHLDLVAAAIDKCLGGGQVAADVRRFASRSPNLFRAVSDCIAVAYRQGCRRELRGASPAVARAFAQVVGESGIARKAAGLNARAWAAGPHFVSPFITARGALALDVIGPDRVDAEMVGEEVERVLWHLPRAQGGSFVLLDAEGWHYYNSQGESTGGDVAHAVGRCPVVPFVAYDGGDDFWATTAHNGLADATLTCGRLSAFGLYSRQVCGFSFVAIFSDLKDLAHGQVLGHPVLPLLLNPGDKVQVEGGRVVKAEDYLSEISAVITMAISGEGLPPGSITLSSNNAEWGSLAIAAEGPRLAAHRDRQVPHLITSERALWPIVCDLIRGSAHRHARVLPPGDEVRDMLRVAFPDLASAKEQIERIEAMKAGLPFGISSPVDLALAARPEVSRDEVDEEQAANLATYIDRIRPLVERNIPGQAPEANGHQTIPQQQGREGGLASGETRAAAAQEKNP